MKTLFQTGLLLILQFCLMAQNTINIQNHKGGIINHKTIIIVKNKKTNSPLLDAASPDYKINLSKDSSITIVQVKNIGNDNAYILNDKGFIILELPANNTYCIPDTIPPVASNESLFIGINQIKRLNCLINYKKILQSSFEKFGYRYFFYLKIAYSGTNKKKPILLHKIYEISSIITNGRFHEANSVKYQDIKKFLITKQQW